MRIHQFAGGSTLVLASMWLTGCASQPSGPTIPADAMQVSSGDRVITYMAPHDGRVYLRDDRDNTVAYSADVRRNQTVKYDPSLDQVTNDGTVAAQKIPNGDHPHSWYYERSASADVRDATGVSRGADSDDNVQTIHVPVKVDVQPQPTEPRTTPDVAR